MKPIFHFQLVISDSPLTK